MRRQKNLGLTLRIARMRYEERRAQRDIAKLLGVSEAAVSRALKEALDLELVEIRVRPPPGRDPALERALRERFGLDPVVVVEAGRDTRGTLDLIGQAVAEEVAFKIADNSVIGVGDGESVAAVARSMPRLWLSGAEVVPLIGGVGQLDYATQPAEIAREIARRIDARVRHLPVPAVLPSAAAALELVNAPAVSDAFAAMAKCSLALVGVGALDETLSLLHQGVLTFAEIEALKKLGAVGMICGRAFDAAGRHVPSDLDQRILSASVSLLRTIPSRFCVACGRRKAIAIKALLTNGTINALGTDAETARLVLDGA